MNKMMSVAAFAAALTLTASCALAATADAKIVAPNTEKITAPFAGTLLPFDYETGDSVSAHETLFTLDTTPVYATQAGTVSRRVCIRRRRRKRAWPRTTARWRSSSRRTHCISTLPPIRRTTMRTTATTRGRNPVSQAQQRQGHGRCDQRIRQEVYRGNSLRQLRCG